MSSIPLLAKIQIVVSLSSSENDTGSFSCAVKNAVDGDTIVFDCDSGDTPNFRGELVLRKNLVIDGKNRATGNKMKFGFTSFVMKKCRISISNMIFNDLRNDTKYLFSVFEDSCGGLFLDSVEIIGRYFYNDNGIAYPAIMAYNGSVVHLSDCRIIDCPGGALHNTNGTVEIVRCEFINNSSYSDIIGGLYNSRGTMIIHNSTIRGNLIRPPGRRGGIIGGAGIVNFEGILTVFNSTLSSNTARNLLTWTITNPSVEAYGGAVLNYSNPSSLPLTICSIFNSTICSNTATAASDINDVGSETHGGGIYSNGNLYITNCTFAGNRAEGTYPGIYSRYYTVSGIDLFINSLRNCLINSIFASSQKGYQTITGSSAGGMGNVTVDSLGSLKNIDSTIAKDGFSVKDLFGRDSVSLSENGGNTATIALSKDAAAIGRGVRTGYYTIDTLLNTTFNIKAVAYIPVYYRDNTWVSGFTGKAVPEGVAVTELLEDQRGKIRSDPPCIGAFEYTKDDVVAVHPERRVKKNFTVNRIVNNTLVLTSDGAIDAKLELVTLSGRVLYSLSTKMTPGRVVIALPQLRKGIALCRVVSPEGSSTRKVIIY
jgi:hypothetical protein